jgi:hypothetical protein
MYVFFSQSQNPDLIKDPARLDSLPIFEIDSLSSPSSAKAFDTVLFQQTSPTSLRVVVPGKEEQPLTVEQGRIAEAVTRFVVEHECPEHLTELMAIAEARFSAAAAALLSSQVIFLFVPLLELLLVLQVLVCIVFL